MAPPKTPQEILRRLQEEKQNPNTSAERLAEIERLEKSINEEIGTSIELQRKHLNQLKEELDLIKQVTSDMQTQFVINDKLLEIENQKLRVQSEELKNQFESAKKAGTLTEEYKKQYIEQQKIIKAQRESLDVQEKGLGFGRKLAQSLGVGRAEDSMIGNFLKDPLAFSSKAVDGFTDMMTPANLLSSTFEKVVESSIALAVAQDQAVVSFNKVTGQAGTYNTELRNLSQELTRSGVDAGASTQAFTNLFKTYKDFTDLNKSERRELTVTAGLLEKMGVSSQQFSSNMVFLTKSFSMSAQEAGQFNTKLVSLANNLGLSVDQITADFDKAKSVLGAVGGDVGQNFANLQAIVKETNLELDKVLSITSKFDTFDSAAQSVGRLNAIMGGPYLSTLEMISETDPSERYKMVAEAVQQAAGSFDTLSYYEKKAYADALGLQDVNDLALVLSGNMEGLQPPEMDSQSIIDMKMQMNQFNTVSEKFQSAMMSLAIGLGPLVDVLKVVLDIFAAIGPAISVAVIAYTAYKAVVASVVAIMQLQAAMEALIAGATGASTVALEAQNAALIKQKAAMAGTIVGAAILGFGVLNWLFQFGDAVGYVATAIAGIAGMVILLGIAEKGTTLFGGGIALLVAAFSMLATCLVVGCSPPLIFAIGALAGAILGLGIAFSIAQPFVWPMIAAFSVLSVAALAFGGAIYIASLGVEKMVAAISNIAGDVFMGIAMGIYEISKALDELPLAKTIAMTALVAASTPAAIALGPAAMAATTAATSFGASVAAGTNAGVGETVSTTTNSTTTTNNTTNGQQIPPLNITLSIDGDQIRTVINKVKVDRTKSPELYNSIASMINRGQEAV